MLTKAQIKLARCEYEAFEYEAFEQAHHAGFIHSMPEVSFNLKSATIIDVNSMGLMHSGGHCCHIE